MIALWHALGLRRGPQHPRQPTVFDRADRAPDDDAYMQGGNVMGRYLSLLPFTTAIALFAGTTTFAGEQALSFKFVVKPIDIKAVQAPSIQGRELTAGAWFGVAFFDDGRVAVKDFVNASDDLNGASMFHGYSTYTFEDGSSITASYTGKDSDGVYTILSGTGLYDKATGTGSFHFVHAFKDGSNLLTGKFDVKTPDKSD
jgi:hypothetical protein